jgi:hypothetical protein
VGGWNLLIYRRSTRNHHKMGKSQISVRVRIRIRVGIKVRVRIRVRS